jgi:flagellar biosynthesis repressor protein FlbT
MAKNFRIALKAGERLYLNGALVRADRGVTLELLNEAVFLLDAYIMRPEDATTPLRRLYLDVQALLIDPSRGATAPGICSALQQRGFTAIAEHLIANRPIAALKALRELIPQDDLQQASATSHSAALA